MTPDLVKVPCINLNCERESFAGEQLKTKGARVWCGECDYKNERCAECQGPITQAYHNPQDASPYRFKEPFQGPPEVYNIIIGDEEDRCVAVWHKPSCRIVEGFADEHTFG